MEVLRPRYFQVLARPMPGVVLLETQPRRDERGFFTRCFCRQELAALGYDVSGSGQRVAELAAA